MVLKWVFGGSGSGKSTYVYNEIAKQSKLNKKKTYIVIVPEQFTMQTQKDMVMLSEAKGIMNIDVLSFMRLAYRVLEDTTALNRPVLEDEGKGMIIRRILREHASEWKSFGKNITRPGFVEGIKSIITEFIQYRIDDAKIKEMISSADGSENLERKLGDLKKVYEYYMEFLEKRYISSEEILKILADNVCDSELLRDSIICIDGFTGFTPVQYLLLRELMSVCSEVYITACIDAKADPFSTPNLGELFYMSKEFIRKCNDIAMNLGCEIADPVWTGKYGKIPWRFSNEENSELAYLEKNMFRNRLTGPRMRNEGQQIRLYEAAGTEEEVNHCVWQIRKHIMSGNYRYREIAIVVGDMGEYARYFIKIFKKHNIPYFIDRKRSIMENPFIMMILLLFENAINGYDRKSVIRLLRNGIVRDHLEFYENAVDEIDNYMLARGLRGASVWKKEFEGVSEPAEKVRQRFFDVFVSACNKIAAGSTVNDYSMALYDFLVENDMSGILYDMADEYDKKNDSVMKKEYEQIYRIVIRLLEQMSDLMGDEKMSLKEYNDILKTGFEEASVGVTPPGTDTVIVGDMTRTRLKDVRILFFLGVNDGIVPGTVQKGGFLSNTDRKILSEKGIVLAPTAKEKIFNDRFYIYLNMTKPSDMLFISYSRKNSKGEQKEPSTVLGELNSMFDGGFEVRKQYYNENIEAGLENDFGMNMWIKGLRNYIDSDTHFDVSDEWITLHKKYIKENHGIYEKVFFAGYESHLDKDVAKELYGTDLSGSVTRFENYALCAYSHFLRYGLKLKERKEYVLNANDVGILFHKTIERFTKEMKHRRLKWQELDKKTVSDITSEIVEEICGVHNNGIMFSDARNMYMTERIKRIAQKSISILAYHIKKGKFEVEDCEVMFSHGDDGNAYKIDLKDGCSVKLSGSIDRLDKCETANKILYKIIDYKTNKKEFSIEEIYNGISMQLAVYLMAAGSMEEKKNPDKTAVPAGVFYFHIDDPVAKQPDNYEKQITDEFKMSGVLNVDEYIPCYIDGEIGSSSEGYYCETSSDVIPVKIKKDGKMSSNISHLTGKQLNLLSSFAKDKIGRFAEEILDGKTDINPYNDNKKNACKYCKYKAVCMFNVKFDNNSYRKPVSKKENDIWDEWWNTYYGVYEKSEDGN